MPSKSWICSITPVQYDVARPGRLVTNRELPQNYFEGSTDRELRLTQTELRDFAEFHSVFNSNSFKVNVTSFFSKHLKISANTIRSIEATKAERCQLIQADEWLRGMCSTRRVQEWLERVMYSLKKKVWMITDVLVLTNTKIRSVDQHTHSVGGGFEMPLLSIAGVPLPTPLDPNAEASTSRDSSHERAVSVPERMVFAIQYSRVKLLKRKRSELAKASDYGLGSKATWTALWEMRGPSEEEQQRGYREESEDDDSDDAYDEDAELEDEDEVLFEVELADDSDDDGDESC